MIKKTRVFRELLKQDGTIVMPGAYDPLSAKVVERAGFETVYMSGAGASAAVLGEADLGIMTMTEMVRQARNIVNAVDIPVIADADAGYGDALNITRTVKEYERAGVAGIHIEDSQKHQCGVYTDKILIFTDEMIGRIKAAKDSIVDDDFMLIARTDALGAIGGGLDEAIRRANLYVEAGADAVWVQELPVAHQPPDIEMFESLVKSINAPLMGAAGYTSHSIAWFEKRGYKIVFYPTLAIQVILKTLTSLMTDVKEKGREAAFCKKLPERGVSFDELMEFTGFYEGQKIRDRYIPL